MQQYYYRRVNRFWTVRLNQKTQAKPNQNNFFGTFLDIRGAIPGDQKIDKISINQRIRIQGQNQI